MQAICEILKEPVFKKTSERAELIKFFVENVKDKKNKPYSPAFISMKLAHIPTKDLYFMISCAKDYANRGGSVGKYFWGSIKVK